MSKVSSRILFIVPYPQGIAPSQRFRFEQYFPMLEKHGIRYDVKPFLDEKAMQVLYKPGNFVLKVWKVVFGLFNRFTLLFTLSRYDFVFVHREMAAVGPPIFEWLVARVFRKKIIFDFDDAIWLKNTSSTNSIITFFKRYKNANDTCQWAWKVSCGNDYLAEHASQFCQNVVVNPTTIDTEGHHNKVKKIGSDKITIGWTGTHSTIKYLEGLVPVLAKLEQYFEFNFVVIADRQPSFTLESLTYIPWSKKTEIEDLFKIDVGLMPLENDMWANGKCGFKALQYMALGIPAIVSPVGVNTKIVDNGVNGWICDSEKEWENRLREILNRNVLLTDYSSAARMKVEQHYSVKSNTSNFLHLFAND